MILLSKIFKNGTIFHFFLLANIFISCNLFAMDDLKPIEIEDPEIEDRPKEFSSPLDPVEPKDSKDIGFFFGLGGNSLDGLIITDCYCDFTEGFAAGYNFGVLYEQAFTKVLRWGAALEFNSLNVTSSYFERESVEIESELTDESEILPLTFEESAEASIFVASLKPYIKYSPWKFAFLRASFGVGIPLSSSVLHTKTLTDKTARLNSGLLVNVKLADLDEVAQGAIKIEGETATIQDGELPDVQTPLMCLSPALGFNIPFSQTVAFSPVFEYNIPLGPISSANGAELSVLSWRIIAELRIALFTNELQH